MLWFSDLRDFTGMNERLEPSEVLELLNNYLQLVGDALGAHGGEILKFIGDGVMGYFPAEDALFLPMVTSCRPERGAPADRATSRRPTRRAPPAAASRCVSASACMSAPVTFGNVGTEDRLDFTVIGPAVNRAARLESLTKELERAGAGLGRVQGSLHPAAAVARHPSPARRCRARRGLYPADLRGGGGCAQVLHNL